MGYGNILKTYEKIQEMKFNSISKDKLTPAFDLIAVYQYLAAKTYDWPPKGKVHEGHLACRYYQEGRDEIIKTFNMDYLTPEQLLILSTEDQEKTMEARRKSAQNRISRIFKELEERKLLKKIRGATPYINAGYLLLLGDETENYECEKWAENSRDFIKISRKFTAN